MSLQSLPSEIFSQILEHLLITIGPFKAVKARLVSKSFDVAILTELTTSQAIEFDDPALQCSLWQNLPCSVKARAMLARVKRNRNRANKQDKSLYFLADVIETLNELSVPEKSEVLLEKRNLMIAEAAAHLYSGPSNDDHRIYAEHAGDTTITVRGQNALCGAVILGDLSVVQTLLQDRTDNDVNAESSCFGHPLHLAAAWGHVAIVQHLLDNGADPRALSHDVDDTSAIFEHSPEDTQPTSSPRGSALRAAARAGHDEIVALLLHLAPDQRPPTTGPEHLHAIVAGAQGGHMGCIELLVRATGKPLAELPAVLHEQMLWEAARAGQQCVVRLLLDDDDNGDDTQRLRLDVDAQRYGRFHHGSALHLAAARGDTAMVRLLVERYGADAGLENWAYDVGHVYQVAARAGHIETLDVLLQQQQQQQVRGVTSGDEGEAVAFCAFRSAVRGAQIGVLRWLVARYGRSAFVRKGAVVDGVEDSAGQLALGYAIVNPAPDVIVFLVRELGVSCHEGLRSLGGMVPMVIAKTESSRWVVDLLLRLGAEDVEVGQDDMAANRHWESFTLEIGDLSTIRGVRVSERTWQWV